MYKNRHYQEAYTLFCDGRLITSIDFKHKGSKHCSNHITNNVRSWHSVGVEYFLKTGNVLAFEVLIFWYHICSYQLIGFICSIRHSPNYTNRRKHHFYIHTGYNVFRTVSLLVAQMFSLKLLIILTSFMEVIVKSTIYFSLLDEIRRNYGWGVYVV